MMDDELKSVYVGANLCVCPNVVPECVCPNEMHGMGKNGNGWLQWIGDPIGMDGHIGHIGMGDHIGSPQHETREKVIRLYSI